MRINFELVRQILTEIADADLGADVTNYTICQNENPNIVGWHIRKLIEAGYLTAIDASSKTEPYDFIDIELTMDGEKFLSKIENSTVWNGIKTYLQENALTISFKAIELAFKAVCAR